KLHMIYGTAESIGCEGGSSTREIDASINERDVLEAFQPNSNLNRLTIEYYKGSSFPNWLGDYHLPNLVSLQLIHCNFCSQFPPLGQLPSLKKLYIHHSDGIEIIGKEFYGNNSTNVPFRSLKVLEFQDMPHWKEWLCVEGFPLLKNLSIKECPMLERDLPQHLPALQKLVISNCQKLEASIPKADNIQELELIECDGKFATELPSNSKKFILRGNEHSELSIANMMKRFLHGELEFDGSDFLECTSLDFSCYDSLPRLLVSGWHFSSVPFALHVFTNLHSLELFDFPQLESFPRGGLPSNLSKLVIHNCPKLICSREDWGLFQLSSLKYFRVSDEFENVESFPEENLLPHTLDTLFLYNCSKLRTMNYKGLLHLKSLYIWSCPCLESLPEEGLSNSLSCLEIGMCPLIKEKYQKEGGERWHTILHIPTIKITE
ncbi:CC-NBS-LRR resistance protein, partial [Trifolium medium]|nr:CC-NBS-LRR resistance protein [Trifolium medium]